MSEFVSWGRYPNCPQAAQTCAWRADLAPLLDRLVTNYGSTLPFGNGRSYGDSCLAVSDHVLHMRSLNRFIEADWKTGSVVAEAGVSLEELLRVTIPRGWFLPVTPGTKLVTLGGALANDVHGKNHHKRGTFGRHVQSFGLRRSDGAFLVCSLDENKELFGATIGGLGLTGIIEWVALRLMPIHSSEIAATHVRFGSLEEFFSISEELDHAHEYAVAWIDCLARGQSVGRGIYIVGDHVAEGELKLEDRGRVNVPVTPPISAINRFTLRLFNTAYYHKHRAGRHDVTMGYDPFFYPLDRVLNWNRIYGQKGFQQYQCVVPKNDSSSAIAELLRVTAKEGSGSFLAVLKRFGDLPSPGLLSFPTEGATLALDFPERGHATKRLFAKLDSIVRAAGGRLYPAKDAHMSGDDFRAWYPAWRQLEQLRDPALCSRFWRRVTET